MEARISRLWQQSGGPAVALLLSRGARDLASGAETEAVADFDAAVALEPDLPEVYARRSVARFQAGDVTGALRDAQEALKREPRHFGVWRSLSRFQEARGDLSGALAAWRKLLEIDPKTSEAQERLLELRRKVEGEAL
jgi:tetratricopeptide (TPR) repeat protein